MATPAPLMQHTAAGDAAVLTHAPLDGGALLADVREPAAGATVLFVGTTRNEFDGKRVERLEYEAYEPLALRTLLAVLRAARERFAVSRLHIAHRLGSVGVTEASILVCAVAPHRRAAFEAAEWMLEEVKREAQIWKKECYANADADAPEWKANRVDNERWHAAKEQQLS